MRKKTKEPVIDPGLANAKSVNQGKSAPELLSSDLAAAQVYLQRQIRLNNRFKKSQRPKIDDFLREGTLLLDEVRSYENDIKLPEKGDRKRREFFVNIRKFYAEHKRFLNGINKFYIIADIQREIEQMKTLDDQLAEQSEIDLVASKNNLISACKRVAEILDDLLPGYPLSPSLFSIMADMNNAPGEIPAFVLNASLSKEIDKAHKLNQEFFKKLLGENVNTLSFNFIDLEKDLNRLVLKNEKSVDLNAFAEQLQDFITQVYHLKNAAFHTDEREIALEEMQHDDMYIYVNDIFELYQRALQMMQIFNLYIDCKNALALGDPESTEFNLNSTMQQLAHVLKAIQKLPEESKQHFTHHENRLILLFNELNLMRLRQEKHAKPVKLYESLFSPPKNTPTDTSPKHHSGPKRRN